MPRRLAVTGVTGFVGGALVRKALEEGWEVHNFGRREVPGTVFHQWDAEIENEETFTGYFDAVVHCAAAASDWGDSQKIRTVNVLGTMRALRLDKQARFIHISTASVYASADKRINSYRKEEGLPTNFLNSYAASKAEAERYVIADKRSNGVVILRPHAIYGPGDTTLLPRVEKTIKSGRLLLPNGGWNLTHLTHIDNLVSVILEVIDVPTLEHSVYNVADRKPVMLRSALEKIMSERGVDLRIGSISSELAWNIGCVLEKVYYLKKSDTPPPLTRYLVSQLGYTQTLDVSRIERQLGRQLPYSDFTGAGDWDKEKVSA